MIPHFRKLWLERRNKHTDTINKWKDFRIPLLSLIVAAMGVWSGALVQYLNINEQYRIKEYEVSFKLKQDLYASFMRDIDDVAETAFTRNREDALRKYQRIESSFYSIEPFIVGSKRDAIRLELADLKDQMFRVIINLNVPPQVGEVHQEYDGRWASATEMTAYEHKKRQLQDGLINALFIK